MAPNAECAAVVKADGYGMGAARCAQALAQAGARTFFVACLGEGLALRAALGLGSTIYVLGGLELGDMPSAHAASLSPVLNRLDQIAAWAERGAWALQVDTGMARLGLPPSELAAVPMRAQPALVMSHLACASDADHALNRAQLDSFSAARARFPAAAHSLAASAGALLGRDYQFDMIRPGIGLYGGAPLDRASPPLAVVATLTAPVLQTRPIAAGASVGYGAAFTAPQDGFIATIGAGYADGVLRSLSGKGYAAAHGRTFPYAGRVSMDLITLWDDAGALKPGDDVELLGASVAPDDLAARAGTIAYEVLTQLARTPRAYHGPA